MTKFDFLSGTNRLRYLVGIPSVSRVVSLSRPGSVSLDMPTDSQPTHHRLTSGTEPTRQRCATSAREVLKFAAVFALLMTVGVGKMWGAYSYSGTGTFTKQSSVDGDGYYVFVLTQGAFTNSCSSDQLGINTSYTGNTSSISNPATSIVMQVTGYTSGKYYIQNSSGSYLYSSATKKIAYSETSQYWTTGDSKLT